MIWIIFLCAVRTAAKEMRYACPWEKRVTLCSPQLVSFLHDHIHYNSKFAFYNIFYWIFCYFLYGFTISFAPASLGASIPP